MADEFDAALPVKTTTVGGPLTSNQTQVNGVAVSVNVGNADAGTQRVAIISDQPAIPVLSQPFVPGQPVISYNTATVAGNATSTHTYTPGAGENFVLQEIIGSGSDKQKIEIKYGPTGSEVTQAVFFTSTASSNWRWVADARIQANDAESILVLRTNGVNSSRDVYSTVQGYNA